jgi:hypothetical protein
MSSCGWENASEAKLPAKEGGRGGLRVTLGSGLARGLAEGERGDV